MSSTVDTVDPADERSNLTALSRDAYTSVRRRSG